MPHAADGQVHLCLGHALEEVIGHLELHLVAAAAGMEHARQQVQVVADRAPRRVPQQQVFLARGDGDREAATVLRQHVDGIRQLGQHAKGQGEKLFPGRLRHDSTP